MRAAAMHAVYVWRHVRRKRSDSAANEVSGARPELPPSPRLISSSGRPCRQPVLVRGIGAIRGGIGKRPPPGLPTVCIAVDEFTRIEIELGMMLFVPFFQKVHVKGNKQTSCRIAMMKGKHVFRSLLDLTAAVAVLHPHVVT